MKQKRAMIELRQIPLDLLSGPINKDAKHRFRCSCCGYEFERAFSKVCSGQTSCPNRKCVNSRGRRQSSALREAIGISEARLEELLPGYLEIVYHASFSELSQFRCRECAWTFERSLASISQKKDRTHLCQNPECRHYAVGTRLTLAGVRQVFLRKGATPLFDEYNNPTAPLRFQCVCGAFDEAPYVNQYKRTLILCRDCARTATRLRGIQSPSWNPNLSEEERKKTRNYPEYLAWEKGALACADHTCAITQKRGIALSVHHLYSFSAHTALRVDPRNAVVISRKHHKQFHIQFGNRYNTLSQFKEYYLSCTGHEFYSTLPDDIPSDPEFTETQHAPS